MSYETRPPNVALHALAKQKFPHIPELGATFEYANREFQAIEVDRHLETLHVIDTQTGKERWLRLFCVNQKLRPVAAGVLA